VRRIAAASLSIDPVDDLRAALANVFRTQGAPIALDDLVAAVAEAAGVPQQETPVELADVAAAAADPAAELHNRQYLQVLWQEILELPVRQRVALLLHARDAGGESVTRLLPLAGIASFAAIAAALEMSVAEFVAIWPSLPLDDLSIASRLGIERQQVINLRHTARQRLIRRMKAPEGAR
jgi:hypothetical protein